MTWVWTIVRRQLASRRLRALLTGTAVALGIAAVLGVQVALAALDDHAARTSAAQAGASDIDVRTANGGGLSGSELAAIRAVHGVATAVPFYEKRVIAQVGRQTTDNVTVTMVAIHDGAVGLRPIRVLSGRLPAATSRTEIALDSDLASALGGGNHSVAEGGKVVLGTATGPDAFTVVGLTRGTSGGTSWTRSSVYVSETAMTSTFALGLRTPLVALRLAPGADRASVITHVRAATSDRVTVADPRANTRAPLAQLRPLLLLLTMLSCIVGAGVTANSVSLSVIERRRQISLMRAGGASGRQVFRLFLLEAATITLAAVPVGIALGLGAGWFFTRWFTVPSDPAPSLGINGLDILLAVGVGIGAAVVGAALPALRAGRLSILAGLRTQVFPERERLRPVLVILAIAGIALGIASFISGNPDLVSVGAACFLGGVAAALPLVAPPLIRGLGGVLALVLPEAAIASRSLARHRNRTALALSGLTVSIAAAVAVAALASGALAASDFWISKLFAGDTLVTSPVTQRDAIADAIRHSSGVRSATELRLFAAQVGTDPVGVAVIDVTAYDSAGALAVDQPDRTKALRALNDGNNVLVPQTISSTTGWHVGTRLAIVTPHGAATFTVAGLVSHSFPAGDGRESIIVGRATADRTFGANAAGFDDLVVDSNGNPSLVQATASRYGLAAVPVETIRQSARDALSNTIGLLRAVAAIGVGVALLAVVNTLLVTIREETRDLALLRAVGLSRWRAFTVALCESGLLTAAGALCGVAAGAVLTLAMLRAGTSPGFAPAFAFPVVTALTTLVAVIAGTMIISLIPARQAVRASIVQALRHD